MDILYIYVYMYLLGFFFVLQHCFHVPSFCSSQKSRADTASVMESDGKGQGQDGKEEKAGRELVTQEKLVK